LSAEVRPRVHISACAVAYAFKSPSFIIYLLFLLNSDTYLIAEHSVFISLQQQRNTMSLPASEGGEKPVTGKDAPVSQATKGQAQDQADIVYPTGMKLALLMISIFVGMFLVSLVRGTLKP
jgi:hypothetical protein